MIIGVPTETKTLENRVALTPGGAESLAARGHEVLVQKGAGLGSGLGDEEYSAAGARIVSADEAWNAHLVIKVKEPLAQEYKYLREDLVLFTYLHLAAGVALTRALMDAGTAAVAYETVQMADGGLPLLTPMSEVAGRMAPQIGAYFLEKSHGGRGILLSGTPGVTPGAVVILGAGTVGSNAAKIAVGLGAQVTMLDVNHRRLQYFDDIFHGRIITLTSSEPNIKKAVQYADLLIGAVLIPGTRAPNLVTRDMLKTMKEGSVIIDVSVDQGGCVETIRPTTHAEPTYVIDGVVHYGVVNMPGAVPRTSTFALCNQTLPYVMRLAEKGLGALRLDPALALGLNVCRGKVAHRGVAQSLGLKYTPPGELLP